MDRAHLRDLLIASDPELGRLRQAARATLTAIVAALVLHQIARAIHQPTSVGLIGINMAMMGSVLVTDPEPRDQRVSLALVPVVASAALALGTFAAPLPWLHTTLLLAAVFVAVWVRRAGPRGVALGMIGFLAYFLALFFQARPAELPLMIAGIFVAAALAYAIRFGLLRERPRALLRRRITGLGSTIAVILFHLTRAVALGQARPRRVQAVQRGLGAVNESALAIEELLTRGESGSESRGSAAEFGDLRGRVFALELAVENLAAAVGEWLVMPAIPAPVRMAVAASLDAAREVVRAPEPGSLGRARRAQAAARALQDPGSADSMPQIRVLEAIDELLQQAPLRASSAISLAPDATISVAPGKPPPASTLRTAVQATVAAALALAVGEQVSSARAYWAVLAAFMVFTRANTRGAMLVRAWQRVIGTVVGVLIGLLVAEAVQGRVGLELAVLFGCMFIAYYTLQVAYASMVAAFTTLIAVLYSLLGKFSPELLYLRVVETIVGAGIGAAVAALVLPSSTRALVRGGLGQGLRMLADHLEMTLVHRPLPERLASARAIDRALRELRTEVQRASGGPSPRPGRERSRVFIAYSAVVFHARPLVTADALAATRGPLREVVLGLAQEARALAARLTKPVSTRVDPRPFAAVEQRLDLAELRARDQGGPPRLWRSLERVDEALRILAKMLE